MSGDAVDGSGARDATSGAPGPDRGTPVRRVTGTGVPVRGDDVDTDQIVPARFLKAVSFDEMAAYAFHDARRDRPESDPHPFDRDQYRNASILVVNDNFGCGSSREHAPQALLRWGIRGIVGESFAEIFADNCATLGVPTVAADPDDVAALQDYVAAHPDATVEVDVDEERVRFDGRTVPGRVDDSTRAALVEGVWDTTAVMRSNLERARAVDRDLPYEAGSDGDGGTGRRGVGDGGGDR